MLTITAPSQILISQEYYNQCIRNYGRTSEFEFSVSYSRSVKHGEKLDIMNVCVNGLGLGRSIADANRWRVIGDQWERTVRSYELLIEDAMISNRPIAALAAAKCLLSFTSQRSSITNLCKMISESSDDVEGVIYPRQYHRFFSHFPYSSIENILKQAKLIFRGSMPSDAYGITKTKEEQNDFICKKGVPSKTTFFLISGRICVEGIPGRKSFIAEAGEEIFGEFSLWFEEQKRPTTRSATLRTVSEECVLLEVANTVLKEGFRNSPAAREGIQLLIANRIIENVKKSGKLFPEVEIPERQGVDLNEEQQKHRKRKKELLRKLEEIYDSFECIKLKESETLLLSKNNQRQNLTEPRVDDPPESDESATNEEANSEASVPPASNAEAGQTESSSPRTQESDLNEDTREDGERRSIDGGDDTRSSNQDTGEPWNNGIPKVFVVFDGALEINPKDSAGKSIAIEGNGEVGANQIVGIYSSLNPADIDGDRATVTKETILVCFDRKKLIDLYYFPYEKQSGGKFKKIKIDGNERAVLKASKEYEYESEAEISEEDIFTKDLHYPEIIEHWDGLHGKRRSLIKRSLGRQT